MLEVVNIQPIKKGAVLAACDVHIVPWRLTMRRVIVFQKGNARWVNLPSREYDKDGETHYQELITFDNNGIRERFRKQVLDAIDAYLETNPDMEPEPVIKETDEVPF